ncbi:MFS general substrate transporter [Cylindrobasidium torrendii FP15055 ss-10]|uniref:MFS general substrate transporter n=1 Tax=Cylindrobasidium torrendii FP15055 ss-10 TaxID=1314674 RepID=A0A0D7BPW1_9AGAR|nr:MFS general substrate transporter [Cylindrobasidium torrendii FP15055 ss-10]
MNGPKNRGTPLPWLQLSIVYAVQLAEPITGTVVYPFLPEFVRRTGITKGDEAKTGYYSGIVGSVFFAAECLTVFQWGRASDVYGRRPILLVGPLGLGLALLGFGLSKDFWMLVVFRALQGVFNGNIGVAKTMIAELSDSTNIGDAFAIMPLMWVMGGTIGPVMGGLLADPAARWPDTIGKIGFFHEHRYFLPCAIAALFALGIFATASIGLKETHPSFKKAINQVADPNESTALLATTQDVAPIKPPTMREVVNPSVVWCMVNFCAVAFLGMGLTALMPLMWSTSIPLGGLGFTPGTIGTIMAIYGITNSILQVFFLGKILRRFGARRVYVWSLASMFVGSLAFALENLAARRAGRVDRLVWTLLILHLGANVTNFAALGAIHVAMVENATSSATLGATNGLAQMAASGVRGFSPGLMSALFSATIDHNIAGGFLVYEVLSTLLLLGMCFGFMIPKMSLAAHRDAK